MSWKEEFESKYQGFELSTTITKPDMLKLEAFIESKFAELIDEIPEEIRADNSDDSYATAELKPLKQQLKAKWLKD